MHYEQGAVDMNHGIHFKTQVATDIRNSSKFSGSTNSFTKIIILLIKINKNKIIKNQTFIPAAKCKGVDFLPAVSLEFTFNVVTKLLTFARSPPRQASNSSLPDSEF